MHAAASVTSAHSLRITNWKQNKWISDMPKDKSLSTYIQSVEQQIASIEQQLHLLRQHLSQLRLEVSKEDRLRRHVTEHRVVEHETQKNMGVEPGMPEKKFLKLKEVCHITGLSRSTVYRMMTTNEFPQRIQISSKNTVWAKSEVDEWIAGLLGNGER